MRTYAILLTLIALTGCASTQEVINTIPQAAGTYAGAAVFGGEVHMNPDPVEYITQKSVSILIELLLNPNK
jgi:uncharacterized protein YceK